MHKIFILCKIGAALSNSILPAEAVSWGICYLPVLFCPTKQIAFLVFIASNKEAYRFFT